MKTTYMKKLKSLREQKNLSYQDTSRSLKISKSYYWQLEHKNRRLSYDMAKDIANIFHLKPDDLFYDEFKN